MDALSEASVVMTDITVKNRFFTMSPCPTQYSGSTIPDWCRRDPLDGAPEWCREDIRSLAAETSSVISSIVQRSRSGDKSITKDTGYSSRGITEDLATTRITEATNETEDSDVPYLEEEEVDESSSRYKRQGTFSQHCHDTRNLFLTCTICEFLF